ncbi:MAG: hypothetical protein WDN04_19420 [Rhodospirillales bacterium]
MQPLPGRRGDFSWSDARAGRRTRPRAANPGRGAEGHPALPFNWDDAIDAFDASEVMAKYLGAQYQDLFSATKAQEQAEFRKRVTDVEYDAYLSSV